MDGSQRRPNRFVLTSFQLGGWLFADLLLGMMVIFLAAIPGVPVTAAPTPTPIPTPTPLCIRTVVLDKNEFPPPDVVVGGNGSIPTIDELRKAFPGVQGKRAGLILTYVHAPNDMEGQRLAKEVNTRLRSAYPDVFTDETIYDVFDWKDSSSAAYGRMKADVYFLSDECKK